MLAAPCRDFLCVQSREQSSVQDLQVTPFGKRAFLTVTEALLISKSKSTAPAPGTAGMAEPPAGQAGTPSRRSRSSQGWGVGGGWALRAG